MYHRVLPKNDAVEMGVESGMYVSPETFSSHLSILDEMFSVLPLHEIVKRLHERTALPKGACAITFDDGWQDNLEFALPELASRGMPATIFAVTDRVGTTSGFWPDEVFRCLGRLTTRALRSLIQELDIQSRAKTVDAVLDHLKELPESDRLEMMERIRTASTDPIADRRQLLDWDELARLAQSGIDIESHGRSHLILTKADREAVQGELNESLVALRARGHGRHGLLAYPSGQFNPEILQLAQQAGYRGAVTTQPGLVGYASDRLALPRIALHDDISKTRGEFLLRVPGSEQVLDSAAGH